MAYSQWPPMGPVGRRLPLVALRATAIDPWPADPFRSVGSEHARTHVARRKSFALALSARVAKQARLP
eukprot:11561733-Alexandrium_andersonii.AAC.1